MIDFCAITVITVTTLLMSTPAKRAVLAHRLAAITDSHAERIAAISRMPAATAHQKQAKINAAKQSRATVQKAVAACRRDGGSGVELHMLAGFGKSGDGGGSAGLAEKALRY